MPATTQIKPIPSEVRARLGKILPMLSSPQPGDVIAAVSAINRLLFEHALDWHDMAAALTGAPAASAAPPRPPPATPRSQPRAGAEMHNLTSQEVKELVQAIRTHHHLLNDRSKAFLAGQLERAKYGRVLFSDKQWKWLMDLAQQAGLA
jgi:hypothetical protein